MATLNKNQWCFTYIYDNCWIHLWDLIEILENIYVPQIHNKTITIKPLLFLWPTPMELLGTSMESEKNIKTHRRIPQVQEQTNKNHCFVTHIYGIVGYIDGRSQKYMKIIDVPHIRNRQITINHFFFYLHLWSCWVHVWHPKEIRQKT